MVATLYYLQKNVSKPIQIANKTRIVCESLVLLGFQYTFENIWIWKIVMEW